MITFTLCLLALIVGYFTYGRLMERVFGPDDRKTPALTKADGVDYIPLPTWKIFMIQFLNIAGLGPIFGAIMGAKFGSSSYLWIVLGSIFAGAVHDYFAGMLSLRNGGESLPEIIGRYLGLTTKQVMRGFTVILMILVGSVFVAGPAGLLAKLTPESLDATFWIIVVFAYYILATLLPVDKIIGKIYPLFAVALLFMAVGILVMLYVNHPALPELWDGLQNTNPEASELPIFPIMFVSIACGAISGFHATQSPLMARCMTSERHGRPVFYGAMITEGIVALIWAAAATYFFHENGMEESNASVIVDAITKEWLGAIGGVLAILGVIAAPITSGDTAFRSARLIVADFLGMEQKSMRRRLYICIPMFIVAIGLLLYSLRDANGFNMIWRYFAWANQTLAVFTLWAITVFLAVSKKPYIITLVPALFMTCVCSTYICIAPEGGRCEECKGEGTITVEMQFMADLVLECESCHGKRFKSDTLEVKFNDKSIYDVLEMTVNQAIEFFNEHGQKKIVKKLLPLQDVGLGYIKLGQASSTLSGGENQRVKLAFYLSQEKADPTMFIFDEPTTGLHFHDIRKLLDAFDALIRRGHSIVIIEHNMDVIKCADYVIDLGPEGGDKGGNIVAVGTPEEVAACGASYTGQFLKEKLG